MIWQTVVSMLVVVPAMGCAACIEHRWYLGAGWCFGMLILFTITAAKGQKEYL